MKSNDSTEMDRLIRRIARRSDPGSRSTALGGDGVAESNLGSHLDADEMNAYAEGALPERTRSRYFTHLADCDSCRKLVTELTLVATSEKEARERVAVVESERKSWRSWLGAIFSPAVLRFAVPALVLFAVVIIAFVATRTQRDSSYVAQRDEVGRNYTPSISANSNASTTTNQGTLENHEAANTANIRPAATASATPNASVEEKQVKPGDVLAPIKAGPTEADQPTVSRTDLAKPAPTPAPAGQEYRVFGEVAKRAETEVAAAQSRPAQPGTTVTADESLRDKPDANRAKAAGKDDDTVSRKEVAASKTAGGAVSTGAKVEDQRGAGRREAAPPPAAPMSRTAPAAKNEPGDSERMRERADEQKISGRTFRRERDAWVDTAYRSSLATTNVQRGSEQYRALVADEPGLRAITQRLSGELFVVWKSRAYRFY